jgi:hypothetical protein
MKILTKHSECFVGQTVLVSINKEALALIPTIIEDKYFQDVSNWQDMYLVYTNENKKGKAMVVMDARRETPSGFIDFTGVAGETYKLESLFIVGADKTILTVARNKIPNVPAEFDVTWV